MRNRWPSIQTIYVLKLLDKAFSTFRVMAITNKSNRKMMKEKISVSNTNIQEKQFDQVPPKDLKAAALQWFSLGYLPLPIIKGEKKPSVLPQKWLSNLSEHSIDRYWTEHPNDDIGLHCSKGLVALDSDSPESLEAMLALEEKYGVKPLITVKTKKGEHHYLKLGEGVQLQQKGSSTKSNPERIDIRSENSYIIAPPSTNKTLVGDSICPFDNLEVITQEFADDLVRHNGGTPESEKLQVLRQKLANDTDEPASSEIHICDDLKISYLRAMINKIDPDSSYDDWVKVMMIAHQITNGSDEGLALVDEWSSQGSLYKGIKEVSYKWDSFDSYTGTPLTEATLCMMLADRGIDALELKAQVHEDLEPFEECAFEVISMVAERSKNPLAFTNHTPTTSLFQYSLLGKLDEVRKYAVDAEPLLSSVALKGQFTVFNADSNVGKTLLSLHMLREAILSGRINAQKVIYANMDDSANGLLVKGEIADELGFHQLAIGYRGLTEELFHTALNDMIASGEASGTLLILDTLKKFVDVMSKTSSSNFGKLIRQYTSVGGSVVALAHTNKNRDSQQNVVAAGTADIRQDADCTYLVDVEIKGGEKLVTFKSSKSRGPNSKVAQFAYDYHESDYRKLLDSVREVSVDESSFDFEVVPQENPDDRMIRAIKEVIGSGFNGKTNLINEAHALTKDSKSKLEKIYLRYVGSDPSKHIWGFTVGERNLQSFFLHPNSTALDPKPTLKSVVQDELISLGHEDIMDDDSDDKLDDYRHS